MLKQKHTKSAEVKQRLLNLSDAARFLGRSVYSTRTLVWSRQIPVVRCGRGKKMWIDREDLEAWIEKNKSFM